MSSFEKLNKINVDKHLEKKAGFDFLKWARAVEMFMLEYPEAEIHTKVNEHGFPAFYSKTNEAFVWITVTVDNVVRGNPYPVLDYRNKPITDPNVFDINTCLQRAMVKAFAMHGLGLYVFAGDSAPVEPPKPITDAQHKKLVAFAEKGVEAFREGWKKTKLAIRERVTEEQMAQLKDLAESADYQRDEMEAGSHEAGK